MRLAPALPALLCAAGLAACAPTPGPAVPADTAPTTVVVVPVAPTAEPSATAVAVVEPPPAPQDTGCWGKPVVFGGGKKKLAQGPVDAGLPGKLGLCAGSSDPDGCRYAVAKIYHDANRPEDAGPIFKEVALAGKTGELSASAAQHYLDSLNTLGTEAEPLRTVCFDEMAASVGPLKARHCAAPSKDKGVKELCTLLERIESDVERLRAEELVKRADRTPENDAAALTLYRQAGDVYMANFNKRCAFHRPPGKKKPEPPPAWIEHNRCEEIAYNAMRAYMAARETALAQAARAAMLDPDNGLDKSALAKKAAGMEIR
jgi:hypothetical protein